MKLILIDDEDFALTLLEHQLARLGYHDVCSHTRAQDALEMLGDKLAEFGMVICDLQMPEMDGVEMIRHLARLGYRGGLVLVSGEDQQVLRTVTELAKAHRLNVFGALQKPVRPEQLQEVLGRKAPTPRVLCDDDVPQYHADDLAQAIRAGQMVNHYQPKVDLRRGVVTGVETLVRWQHPRNGLVLPGHFIDAVERYGLVDELARAVLAAAMRQAGHWEKAGLSLSIAVNVSMDSLCRLDLPDWVAATAKAEGFSLSSLVLEVTESRLMSNPLAALDVLTRLRLKNVGLSIDDFGTGYSSLAQLRDVPFTELKIDKSFVHGASRDTALQAFVEASLGIARQLGMESVAEGVEDRADWDFLRARGCTMAQGYFLARPMRPDQLEDWYDDWQARYRDMAGAAP